MNNKGKAALGIAAGAAAAGLAYTAYASRPKADTGSKKITVEVIHQDGTNKNFEYTTDKEFLGDLLSEEGLIQGDEGAYGLFVTEVDGEKSQFDQDGSWWQLSQNGTPAQSGADSLAIEDGAHYTWTYTAE